MNVVAVAVPAFSPGTPEHALATWVRREGGFVGKVRVETRDGLRGLFVTEPVRAGELLVSVPPGCIVSADEDSQWGLSLRELLTARLVGARTRGQCQPYLDSLPTLDGAPLLCDWSDEELEQLQAAELAELARGMPPFVAASCERVRPYVQAEASVVEWAERMVRTRAMFFDTGVSRRMSLVPVVDLANHRTPPRRSAMDGELLEPVALGSDGESVALVARSDLRTGEEVCLTYRHEGNGQLLLHYGFAEMICADQPCFETLRLGASSTPLAAALHLGSDEADAAALAALRRHLVDGGAEGEAASALDTGVCSALAAACEAELRRMPTSEEEDARELASLSLSADDAGRRRSALTFRVVQKAQLARVAQKLHSLLACGGAPTAAQVAAELRGLRSED